MLMRFILFVHVMICSTSFGSSLTIEGNDIQHLIYFNNDAWNGKYLLRTGYETFAEANATCMNNNGHVFSMSNWMDADFLVVLAQYLIATFDDFVTEDIWIGPPIEYEIPEDKRGAISKALSKILLTITSGPSDDPEPGQCEILTLSACKVNLVSCLPKTSYTNCSEPKCVICIIPDPKDTSTLTSVVTKIEPGITQITGTTVPTAQTQTNATWTLDARTLTLPSSSEQVSALQEKSTIMEKNGTGIVNTKQTPYVAPTVSSTEDHSSTLDAVYTPYSSAKQSTLAEISTSNGGLKATTLLPTKETSVQQQTFTSCVSYTNAPSDDLMPTTIGKSTVTETHSQTLLKQIQHEISENSSNTLIKLEQWMSGIRNITSFNSRENITKVAMDVVQTLKLMAEAASESDVSYSDNTTEQTLYSLIHIGNDLHQREIEGLDVLTKEGKMDLIQVIDYFAHVLWYDHMTELEVLTSSIKLQIRTITTYEEKDVFYDDGDSTRVILPKSGLSKEKSRSRIAFIKYEDDLFFPSEYMAAKVISADMIDTSADVSNLTFPISYSLPLPEVNSELEYRFLQCSFWNFSSGNWSSKGCRRVFASNPVVCSCNHLTNFAIIVRLHYLPEDTGLDVLGKIGCSLSTLGFFLTALCYIIFRELRRSKPGPIHVHMCSCLFIAYTVFLSGANQVHNKTVCIAVAAITQYFFLASWIWMLVEGFAMYKTLVKKLRFLGETFLLKWAIVAYTAPACTVAITLGMTVGWIDYRKANDIWISDPDSKAVVNSTFVHDKICWLHGDALVLGFLTEVGIMFIFNCVLYFVIIRSITWGRKEVQSTLKNASVREYFVKSVAVASLLGVTWSFSLPLFFYTDNVTITTIFSYLFSIFNAFQGVVIFFLFCVRNKRTRKLWMDAITKFFSRGTSRKEEPISMKNRF